mgnify:CR=1 FL=1
MSYFNPPLSHSGREVGAAAPSSTRMFAGPDWLLSCLDQDCSVGARGYDSGLFVPAVIRFDTSRNMQTEYLPFTSRISLKAVKMKAKTDGRMLVKVR